MGSPRVAGGYSALLVSLLLALSSTARAQPKSGAQELVALLDLDYLGATKNQATAVTDRFREELLKSGKVTLVDRSQVDALLNEQALQQTGCTSQECAVKVGKLLGVRKMMFGRVNKVEDTLWVLSCQTVDVETGETLRAESVDLEGNFRAVFATAVPALAARMTGGVSQPPGGQPPPARPTGSPPDRSVNPPPAPGAVNAAFQAWVKEVQSRGFEDKDFTPWLDQRRLLEYVKNLKDNRVPVKVQIAPKYNIKVHRTALAVPPPELGNVGWQWRLGWDPRQFGKMDKDLRAAGFVLVSKDQLGGGMMQEFDDGVWLRPGKR